MLTYPDPPTLEDVESLLTGVGMTVPTGFDAEAWVQAALDEFCDRTGYPALWPAASADYRYDPPGPERNGDRRGGGRRLFFDRGFVSVSGVHAGVVGVGAGSALVAETDYWLMPFNAAVDGKPYTSIEFARDQWGVPKSIKVTGISGYATMIKADAWNAIRQLALALYAEGLREGRGGKAVEWTDGDGVHERKSIELIQQWGATWRTQAEKTMARYERKTY